MHDMYHSPLVQDYLHHVKSCAGLEPPPSTKALFTSYHSHFFDDPKPAFSAIWGEASPNWRWQKRHMEAILGSVQAAVTAVYYHGGNLLRIERDVLAFPRLAELLVIVGNSAMGGGNTQKLDFEYHAYIFAYRRALDYLTRAISALLKQDFHSFRDLPDDLKSHLKHDWVKLAVDVHAKHLPQLGSFISSKENKSARDVIAHYAHVSAGCLNVNGRGVFFAGGGERLEGNTPLGDVISANIRALEEILRDILNAMQSGFPKQS